MPWHEDSSADWILEGKLAVGNYVAAQDVQLLADWGIKAVIGLTPALRGITNTELGVETLTIYDILDGRGNDPRIFRSIVEQAVELLRGGSVVLIHCHAGRSRSIVLAAGVLMKLEGLEPAEAVQKVCASREGNLSPGLEELLWDCK